MHLCMCLSAALLVVQPAAGAAPAPRSQPARVAATESGADRVGDQQYYKQAGKRTLTLRTFFKIVWGSGWGDKKQPDPS